MSAWLLTPEPIVTNASQISNSPVALPGAAALGRARRPFFVAGFCLAYFLAAKLGIATSLPPEGIVVLWPPNAIVLIALTLTERRNWSVIFAATVATEVAADVPDYPLWAAVGYGVVNFSEAALAAVLLSRAWSSAAPALIDVREFIQFLAIGPLFASSTAALFGALVYKIGAPEIDYLHYWRVFWLGDALGLLTIGTTLLAWNRPAVAPRLWTASRVGEALALSTGLVVVSVWALLSEAEAPRVYLIFPFLVWAAMRFGVRGAALAVLTVAGFAIGSAVAGHGPFAGLTRIDAVTALQGLIAVVALSTFILAFSSETSLRARAELQASVARHRKAEARLRRAYRELDRAKQDLDRTVADRTAYLRQALRHNEVLLREVHHRVKNNLQLVSSLLSIHGRSATAPEVREKLSEVEGQIAAITATYDIMQQVEKAEIVDFSEVLVGLCRKIEVSGGHQLSVAVETDGDAPVSANTAVALSLAVNELITNSVKHAGGECIEVVASCRREKDRVLVRIADDGAGFPSGFDITHAEGFGMRMVCSVVRQAGGHIAAMPSKRGAVVEVQVPAIESQEKQA